MSDLCVTPTCARYATPRYAADGYTVCRRDADELRNHCTEIPDLWAPFETLAALLPPRGDIGRPTPGINQSVPLNLVVAAMHDPRTSWAEPGDLLNPQRALAEIVVRVMADGAGKVVQPADVTVVESCRVLGTGKLHRWALAQDWAGLMVFTVKLVRDQLAGLGGEHRPRPVGTCSACRGRLWPTSTGARCGGCGVELGGFVLLPTLGATA